MSAVPHKLAYVAWMTIETVFALSAVAGIVWLSVILRKRPSRLAGEKSP